MSHFRKTLREEFVRRIDDFVPSLNDVVMASRVQSTDVVPFCSVFTPIEQPASVDPGGWPKQLREVLVVVEVKTKYADGYDAWLDQVAGEIEEVFGLNPTMDGLVKGVWLDQTEIEGNDELEQPAGVLTMQWRVLYRIDARTPAVSIE